MEIFKLGAELKKYSIALPNVAEYFDDDRLRHSYHSFGQNQNHMSLTTDDEDELEAYFERFFCAEASETYAYVRFQQLKHHEIAGVYVRIKTKEEPITPYASIDAQLQLSNDDTQPSSEEPIDISVPDLNEDCLREIFEYLNVFDLVSVAEVCPQFEKIAQKIFSTKHKTLYLGPDEIDSKSEMHDFVGLFKHFGSIIEYLGLMRLPTFENDRLLELIADHCQPTLSSLELMTFELKGEIVQKIRPLFIRLRELRLISCVLSDEFMRTLQCCTALTKLKFNNILTFGSFLPLPKLKTIPFRFPELKSISFKYVDKFFKSQIKMFLKCNPQLKKVSIIGCGEFTADILSEIVKYVPLVDKISLNESESLNRDAVHLERLSALKRLTINYAFASILTVTREIVTANIPLDHLNIVECRVSQQLIDSICAIKTLKTLCFLFVFGLVVSNLYKVCDELPELTRLVVKKCDDFSADGLVELVRKAKKLQSFHLLHTTIEIDDESIKTISKIIANRSETIPLKIIMPVKGID